MIAAGGKAKLLDRLGEQAAAFGIGLWLVYGLAIHSMPLIGAIRAKQTADINAEIADDNAKRLIQERARVADLFAAALESGMRTLKMDGMEKVMMGLTDLKQVRAVCIK